MVIVSGGRDEGWDSDIWAIWPFSIRMLVEVEVTVSPLNRRVLVIR